MSTREEINSGWKERWDTGKHRWHMPVVHPYLKLYFQKFTEGDFHGKRIWIPLCGASHDLFWLYQQGLQVVGVEMCEIGVKKFFSELNLSYTVEDVSSTCKRYIHDERLQIIQCDFFDVDPNVLGGAFDYWWDRGGLVAMVPEERQKYIDRNKLLLSGTGRCLMECFEYDTVRSGTPYNIYLNDLKGLFGDGVLITELGRVSNDQKPAEYTSGNIGCDYELVFHLLKFGQFV